MTKAIKIAAFAIVGAVILWACGGAKDAKATGQAFLDAVNKGDCKGAMTYGTEETNKSLQSMIDMKMCEAKNSKIEYGECKEEGDNATLNYTEDGTAKIMTLKKVNGKWAAEWSKGGTPATPPAVDVPADSAAAPAGDSAAAAPATEEHAGH